MIQRIQSVFLLLAAILMGGTFFCPLAGFYKGDSFVGFYSCGIGSDFPTWGVLFFAILTALLALINIFLYKKRKLQVSVGYAIALLIVVYYVTAAVYANAFPFPTNNSEYNSVSLQYGVALPALALIFNLLAIWRIKKDEKLVKSLDRIR